MFTLARGEVRWLSKLHTIVACKVDIWIPQLLVELGHKQQKITKYHDNQSALHNAKNPAFHFGTKHIGVQYHFVLGLVRKREWTCRKFIMKLT